MRNAIGADPMAYVTCGRGEISPCASTHASGWRFTMLLAATGRKSVASMWYDTSPRSRAVRWCEHTSRLPISTNRAWVARIDSVAARKPVDVSEFSTPPAKPPAHARFSAKRVSREPTARSAPKVRTSVRLFGPPAVPIVLQPRGAASCSPDRPIPPAAACNSKPSPARMHFACCRAI